MASTEKECLASHCSGDGVGTQEQDWSRREAPGKGTALKMKGLGCRREITGDARGGAARFVVERLQVTGGYSGFSVAGKDGSQRAKG